jgi:hypothetical protein
MLYFLGFAFDGNNSDQTFELTSLLAWVCAFRPHFRPSHTKIN